MSNAALPVLRTPRLTLRPLTTDDADAITRGIANFDVSKWLAVVPYPYSRADALDFVAKVHAGKKPFWGIQDADGLQGIVGLDDELAYWLARPVWGRGYGFEAARAAVDHWFANPYATDLMSGYFEGNERSGRLLRALGFQFQETRTRYARSFRQDVLTNRMCLTRRRWQQRQGFVLFTPRLTLRPMETQDALPFCKMAVAPVTRHLATIPTDMSRSEALRLIGESGFRGGPGFRLAIEYQGHMIGSVGLGGRPPSLAFFLAPNHWGKGIMTEGLSAFLPEVFDRFPITSIEADHFEDNPASGAVLRKMGFKKTGRAMGTSKGRLEPAPMITYAVTRETLRVPA